MVHDNNVHKGNDSDPTPSSSLKVATYAVERLETSTVNVAAGKNKTYISKSDTTLLPAPTQTQILPETSNFVSNNCFALEVVSSSAPLAQKNGNWIDFQKELNILQLLSSESNSSDSKESTNLQ